jgi:hypothetical protein
VSLDIARRVLGPEHPDTVSLMINLAQNIQNQGRYSESEALNRAAVEINRRVLGPEHTYTISFSAGHRSAAANARLS